MEDQNQELLTHEQIGNLTRIIIANVRLLDTTEREHLARIAAEQRSFEQRREAITGEIATAAEQLYLHAQSRRDDRRSTLHLSPDTTAKWYTSPSAISPSPAEERTLMPKILTTLRRNGLVKRFTRRRIVYSLNRTAIKQHARLLSEKGVTLVSVDPPKNLFSLIMDPLKERVVRAQDSQRWRVIKPRERIPDHDWY